MSTQFTPATNLSDPLPYAASKFEIQGEAPEYRGTAQIAVFNRLDDARLFGAAPAMYAALEKLRSDLEYIGSSDCELTTLPEYQAAARNLANAAAAALAAARGEQ